MSTTTDGITATIPTPTSTSSSSTASSATQLSSSDFIKLMITQLEQQDPTNPTDSNQILTQLSQISTLQANTQMQTSLQGLTLQQSIGAGGNLIGKSVTGVDATSGNSVTGTVSSVLVQNSQVVLQLTSTDATGVVTNPQIPMQNVTSISATAASAGNTSSTAASQLVTAFQNFLNGNTTTPTSATNTTTPTSTTNPVTNATNTLGNAISSILGTASSLTGGGV